MKRVLILVLAVLSVSGAIYEEGDKAYTKRSRTELLESPSVTAPVIGELPWGVKLKVKEVKGRWLRVKGDDVTGWIYSGNVSKDKPPKENKKDLLPFSAGDTTATAAARGLSEMSKDYADRKSLGEAANDVEWMEKQSARITTDEITQYMKKHKKGEYTE
jgi:hypothetical protein